MKAKGAFAVFACFVSAVFGSTGWAAAAGRQDNSSLVVWIFLGFCALIVVAQLMPLLLQLRVFAHRQREAAEEQALESEPVKADK